MKHCEGFCKVFSEWMFSSLRLLQKEHERKRFNRTHLSLYFSQRVAISAESYRTVDIQTGEFRLLQNNKENVNIWRSALYKNKRRIHQNTTIEITNTLLVLLPFLFRFFSEKKNSYIVVAPEKLLRATCCLSRGCHSGSQSGSEQRRFWQYFPLLWWRLTSFHPADRPLLASLTVLMDSDRVCSFLDPNWRGEMA